MYTPDPSRWVNDYGNVLLSFCMMRVSNRQTAEDLVQETFLSALRSREQFKGNSSIQTWLIAILRNKIIDHYRKNDILKDASSYLHETEAGFSDHFFNSADGHWVRSAMPADWSNLADQVTEGVEFEKILQACVQRMPAKLAPVFIAKFLDDEDSETICKVHGLSSSNYWVIIHRAKLLMRSCLEKKWFK